MPPRTSAYQLKNIEITRQCFQMRMAGAGYEAIGKAVGISHNAALKRVKRVLAKTGKIQAAEGMDFKVLEQERRDRALVAIWPLIQSGDLGAIDRLLSIQKRTAEAMGTDTPPQDPPPPDRNEEDTPENRGRIGHFLVATNGGGSIQPGDKLPAGFEEPSGLDGCSTPD